MQDAEFGMWNSECGMQDAGYRIHDPGFIFDLTPCLPFSQPCIFHQESGIEDLR
jgi:hypothetical protein